MVKRLFTPLFILSLVVAVTAQTYPDKKREGLIGPVFTLSTHITKFKMEAGKWVTDAGGYFEAQSFPQEVKLEETDESEVQESSKAKDDEEVDKETGAGYGSSSGHHGSIKVDKNGRKVMTVHYSPENELLGKDYFKYDANGNEIEESCYSDSGQLKSHTVTRYDDDEHKIEKTTNFYFPLQTSQRWKWIYDSGKNPIEELYYENEVLKHKSTLSYEYDEQGNWIERVKLTMDREQKTPGPHLKEVTTRRIEYSESNVSK